MFLILGSGLIRVLLDEVHVRKCLTNLFFRFFIDNIILSWNKLEQGFEGIIVPLQRGSENCRGGGHLTKMMARKQGYMLPNHMVRVTFWDSNQVSVTCRTHLDFFYHLHRPLCPTKLFIKQYLQRSSFNTSRSPRLIKK